ncbi:MAG: hypothetical protein KAH57_03505 [Thermoplasmata archaeon]|nr:hypothetical protein [Thermoplasmata archaeon]
MKGKKRERIIRVLLNEPDGSLTKYRVAKNAGTSVSWTIEYLRSLEDLGLIVKTKVKDFEGLLNEWFRISKMPRYFDFFINDPKSFLKEVNYEYTLTTYFADTLTNRILFPSRADVYIRKEDFNKWRDSLLEKGLMGKGNFRLLLGDEHISYNKIKVDGLWIVSKPQLMIDLKREGGVCLQSYEKMVKEYV